jgi:hypothetical protein
LSRVTSSTVNGIPPGPIAPEEAQAFAREWIDATPRR